MASTGQAHENHNGAVLECSTPRKLDGRCPLGLLLQLLRSLCPVVANGRRLEESDLAHYWWEQILRRAPSKIALKLTTSHGLQPPGHTW